MTAPSDTRTKILDIAERLVMQRGYHAFSYQHVSVELGVKNAAVHYHFRTKPDLVCAVLDRYGRRFRRWAAALEGASPAEQLDAYLALNRAFVEDDRVCALGMMASHFGTVPEVVQAATSALQVEILAFYTDVLARGRGEGAFQFDGEPGDRAAEVACTVMGASQLARVAGPESFDRVAKGVRRSLTAARA